MGRPDFQPGDWVIYRVQKRSNSPGVRARDVFPAPHGDTYSYLVDKFWIVEERLDDQRLKLRTRRGKRHLVQLEDPRLRHPRWWEKWLYGARFRAVEESLGEPTEPTEPAPSAARQD